MFDVIRKAEYFECLDRGFANPQDISLKGIQDAWTIAQLKGIRGKRIIEVGGGDSRVLPMLEGNQRWNVDKFEGVGQGPTTVNTTGGVEVIRAFFGEFDPSIPQVDVIFSISVVEHIPFDGYKDAFADMARCLVPGGIMYHTVDLPLNDVPLDQAHLRIQGLKDAIEQAGLEWIDPPAIGTDVVFESDMASNSDLTMWSWTRICDKTKITAPLNQIVSIKLIARKPY
jgi:hypothetical protein